MGGDGVKIFGERENLNLKIHNLVSRIYPIPRFPELSSDADKADSCTKKVSPL